jgi:hypothetical protein
MLRPWRSLLALTILSTVCAPAWAQRKKEFRYTLGPGALVSVTNDHGPISVRSSNGPEIVVTASFDSNKAEVEGFQNGNRVEVRTRVLQKTHPQDGRVGFEVLLPTSTNVSLRSSDGPMNVTGVTGDVTCEGESSQIEVKNGGNGHVHVRTMDGQITLSDLKNAHVELQSTAGNILISSSVGPYFDVHTAKGSIRYNGDFAGDGNYSFTTHTGDIGVMMPANASVEISARSVTGTVEDGFQLQPLQRPMTAPITGKTFAGRSNNGASAVRLRSFSGKISVKKK